MRPPTNFLTSQKMSKIDVTVQIGNTDDKLKQAEWSRFVGKVEALIPNSAGVYFSGFSNPAASWQNACWVFSIEPSEASFLHGKLKKIREEFLQESVAWTEGKTVFI